MGRGPRAGRQSRREHPPSHGRIPKFGGMNLVEYWLDWHPSNSEWADGWKVRAEPQYALKDAMQVFIDFVSSVDTDDRIGLAVYDATNGNAILESPLTNTLSTITNI